MNTLRCFFTALLLMLSHAQMALANDVNSLFGLWQDKASGDILVFSPAKDGKVALEYYHQTSTSCLTQWQPGEETPIIYLDPSDLKEYSLSDGQLIDDDGFDRRIFTRLSHLPNQCA